MRNLMRPGCGWLFSYNSMPLSVFFPVQCVVEFKLLLPEGLGFVCAFSLPFCFHNDEAEGRDESRCYVNEAKLLSGEGGSETLRLLWRGVLWSSREMTLAFPNVLPDLWPPPHPPTSLVALRISSSFDASFARRVICPHAKMIPKGGWDAARSHHCFRLPAFFGQRHNSRLFCFWLTSPFWPNDDSGPQPSYSPFFSSFSSFLYCNPKESKGLKTLSSACTCVCLVLGNIKQVRRVKYPDVLQALRRSVFVKRRIKSKSEKDLKICVWSQIRWSCTDVEVINLRS